MKARCPNQRCQSGEEKKVVFYHDGKNHIDGLKGWDLECVECGQRFLQWESTREEVKKAYGEAANQYL